MSLILCTGGFGFIGSHLVDKLISLGHKVVILDNLSSGKQSNVKSYTDFFPNDICNNLDFLFGKYKFDYVFHLAAFIDLRKSITNPKECYNDNVMGSINLINYCIKHNIKKLIFSSTGGAIYSPEAALPWDELSLAQPASPYGLSKLAIEQYLKLTKNLYKLDYTVLRYSNVYGPRQGGGECGAASIFINNALNDKQITIFGDGNQTRDFIYVDDVVSANVLAMQLDGTYNVSTNIETSVNKIAELISNKLNYNNIVYASKIEGEVLNTRLSSNLLQSEGWKPTVDIENGISKTIEYFKAQI